MDTFRKYWWLWILIAFAIIYFSFKQKIDKYLQIAKSTITTPSWESCKTTFFAKLPDGKIRSFHSQNDGTESAPNMKYYKSDVTLSEDGITNATADVEITKVEFDGACQYLYKPPYKWYTEESPVGNMGRGSVRRFAEGGTTPHTAEKICIPRKFAEPGHVPQLCPYNFYDNNGNLYVMQTKVDGYASQCCYELRQKSQVGPIPPSTHQLSCTEIESIIKNGYKKLVYFQEMAINQRCNISQRKSNQPISAIVDPITAANNMTCDQIQNSIHKIQSFIDIQKQQLAKLNCNKTK